MPGTRRRGEGGPTRPSRQAGIGPVPVRPDPRGGPRPALAGARGRARLPHQQEDQSLSNSCSGSEAPGSGGADGKTGAATPGGERRRRPGRHGPPPGGASRTGGGRSRHAADPPLPEPGLGQSLGPDPERGRLVRPGHPGQHLPEVEVGAPALLPGARRDDGRVPQRGGGRHHPGLVGGRLERLPGGDYHELGGGQQPGPRPGLRAVLGRCAGRLPDGEPGRSPLPHLGREGLVGGAVPGDAAHRPAPVHPSRPRPLGG